jgi:hypothetical protein
MPIPSSGDFYLSNSTSAVKYAGNWNLASVMAANDQYRSGGFGRMRRAAIASSTAPSPRTTTSPAASTGLPEAATADRGAPRDDHERAITIPYLKAATCAEIAELMLPGCTWIYYGDELGMTATGRTGRPPQPMATPIFPTASR